jgi:hypothetical protein
MAAVHRQLVEPRRRPDNGRVASPGAEPEPREQGQEPADGEQPIGAMPLTWERPVQVERPAYRMPEVKAAYRLHLLTLGAVLLPLTLLLVPVMELFFLGVVWVAARDTELAQRLGPVAGVATAVAVVALSANWLALLGNRRLRRAFERALAEREGREGGVFVSVSNPADTSFYQSYVEGQSDLGMLYLDPHALVFEGMRTRMEIPRTDLQEITLTPNWQFIQLGARWCELRYRGEDRAGRLRVTTRELRTIRGNLRRTRSLKAELERWWTLSA